MWLPYILTCPLRLPAASSYVFNYVVSPKVLQRHWLGEALQIRASRLLPQVVLLLHLQSSSAVAVGLATATTELKSMMQEGSDRDHRHTYPRRRWWPP